MQHGLDLKYIAAAIVTLLISMTIHEFMHGFVAYKLGDDTAFDEGRLSFNPMRHIDPFMTVILPVITLVVAGFPIMAARPVPFNPDRVKYEEYGAALLAVAGPLSNFVLAALASLLLHIMGGSFGVAGYFLSVFAVLNVILFVFNLVPIPPLDGSRVLYAFAPEAVQDFMRSIEPYGFFIIFALLFIGSFNNILVSFYQVVLHFLGLPGIQ
jgi:Zn-dependent protease